MMNQTFHYLFGPVPSRRLGRSLGIDVTPLKTCSFDCLYCQCGCTTKKTAERKEFVPFKEVCSELEAWLDQDGAADVITFAGSGEPTLYSRLGDLIDFIKKRSSVPVAVLSNGSLLHRPGVRRELMHADVVKTGISAWDEDSFRRLHRPAADITFSQILDGAREFRAQYRGQLWVEVFLLDGMNSAPEQVRKIAAATTSVRPDQIHLNTAVRPAADPSARPLPVETLNSLCGLFTPRAEVIPPFTAAPPLQETRPDAGKLAALLQRHPATREQLAEHFGTSPETLAPLLDNPRFQTERRDGHLYYRIR